MGYSGCDIMWMEVSGRRPLIHAQSTLVDDSVALVIHTMATLFSLPTPQPPYVVIFHYINTLPHTFAKNVL